LLAALGFERFIDRRAVQLSHLFDRPATGARPGSTRPSPRSRFGDR
jgi:hypothetical protein